MKPIWTPNSKEKEKGKIPFEVRLVPKNGTYYKEIFIGGEKLDFSIDVNDYRIGVQKGYGLEVKKSIVNYFCHAVSDCVGRKITVDDIIAAQKSGYI
jgi:hypothetical protein